MKLLFSLWRRAPIPARGSPGGAGRAGQEAQRRSEMMSAAGKCLAVLLAFGLLGYQGYWTATTNGLQVADTLATTVAASTEQTLSSAELVLKSVVDSIRDADPETEDDLVQLARTPRQFEDMRQLIRNHVQIDVTSAIALDGALLVYSRSFPPPPQNLGDRDYFKAALELSPGQAFLSDPVQNKTNSTWTFYLATPIRNRFDKILGVAIVGIQSA